MRILYVMPWIRQGGAECDAMYSAWAMQERGHQVAMTCLYADTSSMVYQARQLTYLTPPLWLSRLFQRSKLILYIFGPLVLLWLVWRNGRNYDVWHPHSIPAPWICVLLQNLFPGKGQSSDERIFWLCNEPPHALPFSQIKDIGFLDWLMWQVADSWLDQYLCSKIKKITVYSRLVGEQVKQRYGREPKLIRLGIDYGFWAAERRSLPSGKNRTWFTLLMVGRLHPQKNQLLALRVLYQLKDDCDNLRLVLVGEGRSESLLRKTAEELGIADRVLFFGPGSPEQVRDWYYTCDLVLYPSIDQAPPMNQSWGLVPFEALAAGKLSIVSEGTGAAEVLSAENIGFVAPPTVDSFAEYVREYYHACTEHYVRQEVLHKYDDLVARGRRYVKDCLSWQGYAKELESWLLLI